MKLCYTSIGMLRCVNCVFVFVSLYYNTEHVHLFIKINNPCFRHNMLLVYIAISLYFIIATINY